MKRLVTIFLIFYTCSTVMHKPVEVAQLEEVIQRVEADESIPKDRKIYYEDKFRAAKDTIEKQGRYIIQLESKVSEQSTTIDDLKLKHKSEVSSMQSEIASLKESKGRIKQMDYQFFGLIALLIFAVIFIALYIFIKFGSKFTPAGASSGIMTEIIKKASGV